MSLNLPPDIVELMEKIADRGFAVTARCMFCGAPLTAAKSIVRHAGPTCAARNKNSGLAGDPTTNPTDKTAAA